jgi:hypothetical protein
MENTVTAYLAAIGRRGGQARSEKKTIAARLNAQRPRRKRKQSNDLRKAKKIEKKYRQANRLG